MAGRAKARLLVQTECPGCLDTRRGPCAQLIQTALFRFRSDIGVLLGYVLWWAIRTLAGWKLDPLDAEQLHAVVGSKSKPQQNVTQTPHTGPAIV